ncbi:MAG TPA: UvrD-helicase domain-containing protein [Candidatus Acidoferrales bacterium]|nr:UvrD-helicase domain-containing protein [Candidatus Acidoferrales bacterium]
MDLLEKLNEQQREAVTTTDGALLVLAGAGSGKTRVITHRLAYLIEQGVAPGALLAVTFTNKAAEQMRDRAGRLLAGSGQVAADVWIATFHAFCARLLRREAPLVGLPRNFTIFDEEDQQAAVKQAIAQLGHDEKALTPRAALDRISGAKNIGVSPGDAEKEARDARDRAFAQTYARYEDLLRAAHAVDFDDLLLRAREVLRDHAEARALWSGRFRYLHVDEYQDTNRMQYDILRLLAGANGNLCVVGDEDQSIYSWRGADVRHILRFEQDFPGARIVRLEKNYRSMQTILDAAGAVVAHNQMRIGKTLEATRGAGVPLRFYEARDAAGEAEWITEEIARLMQEDGATHLAVFYRTNAVSRSFEEALRRRSIAYRLLGGFSFYRRAEVKDALAYLRVARNPDDDVALLRILNVPPRGIGKTTLESLRAAAREKSCSIWAAIGMALEAAAGRALAPLREFRALVEALGAEFALVAARGEEPGQGAEIETPVGARDRAPVAATGAAARGKAGSATDKPPASAAFLGEVLQRTGYLDYLQQQNTSESQERSENLQELVTALEEAEEADESLEQFLDRAALVSDADTFDERARVTLMTVHSAKGLEFDHVFLAGMEEGLFPHVRSLRSPADIEEERRLCYVGMTRAKDTLTLTRAVYRPGYWNDEVGEPRPSRFLFEIPEHLIEAVSGSLARAGEERRYVPDAETEERKLLRRYPMRGESGSRAGASRGSAAPRREPRPAAGDRKPSGPSHPLLGIRVRHKSYGVGTIIAVEGEDDERRLTVSFLDHGTKKLVERYANLERV